MSLSASASGTGPASASSQRSPSASVSGQFYCASVHTHEVSSILVAVTTSFGQLKATVTKAAAISPTCSSVPSVSRLTSASGS
jgi:hypothetical protein